MGFIHIAFGILVFSSVQFVSVWDVMNKIIIRYLGSTFATRMILLIEIGGLRQLYNKDKLCDLVVA